MSRKLEIWCDSGANIHSCRREEVRIKDLGYTDEEWDEMTEDEKTEAIKDIAFDRLDWGFREL